MGLMPNLIKKSWKVSTTDTYVTQHYCVISGTKNKNIYFQEKFSRNKFTERFGVCYFLFFYILFTQKHGVTSKVKTALVLHFLPVIRGCVISCN